MSGAENTRNFYRNQGIAFERDRIAKRLEIVAKLLKLSPETIELILSEKPSGIIREVK
jgi:hypothetical protein